MRRLALVCNVATLNDVLNLSADLHHLFRTSQRQRNQKVCNHSLIARPSLEVVNCQGRCCGNRWKLTYGNSSLLPNLIASAELVACMETVNFAGTDMLALTQKPPCEASRFRNSAGPIGLGCPHSHPPQIRGDLGDCQRCTPIQTWQFIVFFFGGVASNQASLVVLLGRPWSKRTILR